jgi:RHS repeat-associated protein
MLAGQRTPRDNTPGDSRDAGTDKTSPSPPAISLPKGGGAIRGIGEKFAVNPVTGTGSMTVPIATSPGRSNFGPQLALSYDSGAGNGPFGFGWSLSLPSITRKTDKGLPQYQDTEESDVFMLSGAEDLVPTLVEVGGQWQREALPPTTVAGVKYNIQRYRPRIEGLFARIERWTRSDGDMHWRSISRDNILTIYGRDENSRIADPADPRRIFTWLICETRDDKGNAVLYEYKPEDGARADLTHAHERNRGDHGDVRRKTNRYIKRIRYGNRTPLLDDITGQPPRFLTLEQILNAGWMFEVVFDYGEHDADAPKPDDAGQWTYRDDRFSSYRAGFEVRTTRLCQRVLMVHHFPDEEGVGSDCLVRSTDFTYSHEQDPTSARNPVYTFLRAVTQSGYKREGGGYLTRSLPPVEFEYSQPVVQDAVEEVDFASLENLPIGLDGAAYQWTDLHGEGIPGILTEQAGAWFYKRNLSPVNERRENRTARTEAKFAPMERVALKPNLALAGGAQFMDLAGDGQPDLVVLDGPVPGLYEHDEAESWQPFRPFPSRLNRDMRDPNLKFVDLDGDGHADVLITEDDAFVWHASLAEEGFGPARRVAQSLDEEKGPRLVFADGTQSIYLADMSDDGLADLVRIHNGEVCYWPNLGYGRFGAKVTMDFPNRADPPSCFDHRDRFDHKRILLADIDGTGTTDIIYLDSDGVRLYFNQSGNSWSAPQTLRVFPCLDDLASVTAVDLLGNGTACLVWSSPLPGDAGRSMRYVNLMGGQKPDQDAEEPESEAPEAKRLVQKPHLLVSVKNNLGAETRVEYAPSTKFFLQDKYAGTPWITRLPFPVHVVERVETYDHISRNRFVTQYKYHHGYFDGVEREFRGFGMVEQLDTEEFAALTKGATLPETTNLDAASHVPPVHTKTWFHTGVFIDHERISRQLAHEYYGAPARDDPEFATFLQTLLDDTVLPARTLTAKEVQEACRSLKGTILRQEVYADDGGVKVGIPYSVSERNYTIEVVQRQGANRHAVFFTHPREGMSYHYERNPQDPRVQHELVLKVDGYGNVERAVTIGYPRANVPEPLAEQHETHMTLTLNRFANRDDQPDWYRVGLPVEARTYELVKPPSGSPVVSFVDLQGLVDGLVALVAPGQYEPLVEKTIPYQQWDWRKQWNPQAEPGGPENTGLRLVEHLLTRYRKNDLTGPLALGQVDSLALPYETYKLAFTPGLLAQVYRRGQENLLPDPVRVLGGTGDDQGAYVDLDGNGHWWMPSGQVFYDPNANPTNPATTAPQELLEARQHFFLPRKFTGPFGHSSTVDYQHDLLAVETKDALGNTVHSVNDYCVLQPRLVTDPNNNQSEAAFDALGMVVGTAMRGKTRGDSLDGFRTDLTQPEIDQFFASPTGPLAATQLGNATMRIIYDGTRYQREPDRLKKQPAFAAALARETHTGEPLPTDGLKIQVSFSYSDGFGREIQKKIQAEKGPVPRRDPATGRIIVDNGQPVMTDRDVEPRWVGSGWTIFNNKGKPVRQYEPFFTDTHAFEFEPLIGVSPVLFYDPVERVVATLHPNHTYEKVVLDPWQQTTYDVNDTVAATASGIQTGHPRTDPDIAGYVAEYFKTQPAPWETWHVQRMHKPVGDPERDAAQKAAAHTDTPTVAHFDTLGRPFLTVVQNRFVRNGAMKEEPYATRVKLDIEGNQRAVIDTKDRIVMRYDYDMLGNVIHQASMEAGERWMLGDVTGKPIRAWDSRRHTFRTEYDVLRRATRSFVSGDDPQNANREMCFEVSVYGEKAVQAQPALNLRGKLLLHCDGAGVVVNADRNPHTGQDEAYDFKGNPLRTTRRLAREYKETVDWNGVRWGAVEAALSANPFQLTDVLGPLSVMLETEPFTSSVTYDALNRPTAVTTPDGSVYRPTFNDANLLDKVDVDLHGAVTPFVTNIDYNAKGQRTAIHYGNGALTTYDYDPLTFRLTHLKTTRPAGRNGIAPLFVDPTVVQDLRYTYDPAGNITRIHDAALKTIFHNQQTIEPACSYTYDAVYRLIEAKDREHIGQMAFDYHPPNGNRRDYPFVGHRAHPNDLQALRNYTDRYEYDAVGNFDVWHHDANGGSWTRRYDYHKDSLIEPRKQSNRLTQTRLGNGVNHTETYSYTDALGNDVHGCMTAISSMKMVWDFEDQLQQVDLGGGGTVYYVYDASGQRVRKVIHRQNGTPQEERIYLGGYEIYREYNGDGQTVTLERETLHVMDDKQRIALVETKTAPASSQPMIRYQLGSASVELDKDGGLISYDEYHPYGTTSYQAMGSAAEVSLKRFRYTGKERDEETGLYYHGARYYAPWLGRWTAPDPLSLKDSLNVYQAFHNNPVKYSDPTGTQNVQPKLPAKYGDIKNYNQQSIAIRDQSGKRTSEHEHIVARINMWLTTYDAEMGVSAYEKSDYRVSATLTIPRDMALIKTAMDMALRDALKEALRRGYVSPMLLRQMSVDAAIDRTIKARDAAFHARQAAGNTNVDDLKAITNDKIAAAAAYQMGQVFDAGKRQNTESVLRGDAAADIDKDIDAVTGADQAKKVSDVFLLIFVLSFLSGGKGGDPPKYRVDVKYRIASDAESGSKTPKIRVATPEEEQAAEQDLEEEAAKQEEASKKAKGNARVIAENVAVPLLLLGAVAIGVWALTKGDTNTIQRVFAH